MSAHTQQDSAKHSPATKGTNAIPAARKVHYILSSHWDREWYLTFQDFRRRLVRLMDRILDDIESGTLKGPFTTDGQSIILDDYLEIRPERSEQVKRFASDGRLNIGPWYVLPDEWLVSGESIIRNLRLGRKQARDFGGTPSNAGFVCDLFGHISQLPQIFKNFDINAGLLWRGLEPRSSAHVIWYGADGTQMPCYRFGRAGYCDYSWNVRRCVNREEAFEPQQALADLTTFLNKEAAHTKLPPLIVFDGGDHLEHDTDHYKLLTSEQPSAQFPYQIVHSTLDAYLTEVLEHAQAIDESVQGELRENARLEAQADQQWLIPGVLSSRVWIKQANAATQTLLTQWAEPFAALASTLTNAPAPHGYLNTAWKWLLQNHPHDSICGCSIDAVHEDMKYRFAQAAQIARAQVDESLSLLAASVCGKVAERELRVLVANPLPRPFSETTDITLHIPAEWGCFMEFFGFEPKTAFRIYDAAGNELPWQLLSQRLDRKKLRLYPDKFPKTAKTHEITVSVRLQIPALGYTTLTVREAAYDEPQPRSPIARAVLPVRHSLQPGLATSEHSMANEYLAVTIEPNGTLTITDKRNGEVYSRLLTFEDCADIGDGWFHGQAVNDQFFVSTSAQSQIALQHNGPEHCEYRIRTTLYLPESFDSATGRRSEHFLPLTIDTFVTLRAGIARVEIRSKVNNTVKDHRLRILFPTGAASATHYQADGAFDVLTRPIALPADNHLARELVVETTPQQSWTAVCGSGATGHGNRGLAIVSEGLMESTVRDLPERPIALTLLRGTRRTVHTDGEPEGQIIGMHEFRYWIIPQQSTEPNSRALCEAGQQLAAGLRLIQLTASEIPLHRPAGSTATAPAEASLLELKGEAVLSSMRQVDGAIEARLFNPADTETSVTLALPRALCTATIVNFESAPLQASNRINGELSFTLKPKEIVTWRFTSDS